MTTLKSNSLSPFLLAALLFAGAAFIISPAAAQEHSCHSDAADQAAAEQADAHAHHAAPKPAPASATTVDLTLPNVELLDQDGQRVRVHDLLTGKVVAMNFVFTTCTTVCPPMGAHFARLQKQLGDRPVELISISIDPTTDTPQRLKAWSEKFGAQDGWTLLTGEKLEVDKLLKALGVFTPDFAEHSPVILVGDASRDRWTRAYGLAPPEQILALLDQTAPHPHHGAQEVGR